LPDALERAAKLDATYGRTPDLEKMPMYGVVFSFKDPFDTKDMRSTAGGDAAYDIDFPARDHVLVEQLRKKGAIIFAKAVNTEYNGRAGDPGGPHEPDKVLPSVLGYQRSTWPAIRRIRTIPGAPPHWDRVRVRPSRSAPIS
jgi:amidase